MCPLQIRADMEPEELWVEMIAAADSLPRESHEGCASVQTVLKARLGGSPPAMADEKERAAESQAVESAALAVETEMPLLVRHVDANSPQLHVEGYRN